MFTAVAAGGVIFAYLGFEQAIQLGGESRNPKRNIPLAVIGSMVLGVVLYIVLQVAFLGALKPRDARQGWDDVAFGGNGAIYGPFAGPRDGASGSAGSRRSLHRRDHLARRHRPALRRHELAPDVRARRATATSRGFAMLTTAASRWSRSSSRSPCGMIVFLPFPGWQKLVGFITSATVLAYAMAPLALGALRREEPDRERPFRLPAGGLLAPLAFVVANELILFSGWTVVWKLIVAIADRVRPARRLDATAPPDERPPLDWRAAIWIVAVPDRPRRDLLPLLVRHVERARRSACTGRGTRCPSAGTCS